jgi:predicted PurR-regulated permease PerM
MPRWLPRAFVVALALLALFQFGHWVFARLVGLLVNVLISFFCALAIEPAVDWLARRHMRRGLATGLVILVLFLAAGLFLLALGSLLVDQITTIGRDFPNYVDDVVRWTNRTFNTHLDTGRLRDRVLHSDWARHLLTNGATSVWGISTTVIGTLFQLFTVLLFTFYLSADGPRLRRTLCSMLPPARQAEVLRAWDIAVAKTGGYLYSRALMALVSGVAHYVLLQVLEVPYAPALAVWVGLVSQFIPTVGTYLAGALPVLIAFTKDPWSALWVLCFVAVYQQFENYVLQPRITARTVDIHPAVAFGSVIAGTALLGAVGALIAIPATATLQGFFTAYVRRYEVAEPPPEGPRGADEPPAA